MSFKSAIDWMRKRGILEPMDNDKFANEYDFDVEEDVLITPSAPPGESFVPVEDDAAWEGEIREQMHAEDAVKEEPVTKPPFTLGRFSVLGKPAGRVTVVSTGPETKYVNRVFGVVGDAYTEETANAVTKYQEEHGLPANGKVNSALYQQL